MPTYNHININVNTLYPQDILYVDPSNLKLNIYNNIVNDVDVLQYSHFIKSIITTTHLELEFMRWYEGSEISTLARTYTYICMNTKIKQNLLHRSRSLATTFLFINSPVIQFMNYYDYIIQYLRYGDIALVQGNSISDENNNPVLDMYILNKSAVNDCPIYPRSFSEHYMIDYSLQATYGDSIPSKPVSYDPPNMLYRIIDVAGITSIFQNTERSIK